MFSNDGSKSADGHVDIFLGADAAEVNKRRIAGFGRSEKDSGIDTGIDDGNVFGFEKAQSQNVFAG